MFPYNWLLEAQKRLAPHVRKTPLTHDSQRNLWLKWENRQITGSFKLRGALNKTLLLEDWERQAGLVTASAGNHGQGLAFAAQLSGAPVKVFASDHAVARKIEAMRALGAEVELVAGGYELAEAAAIRYAAERGATFVSAYNDAGVIAGQGTLALEILEEAPQTDRLTWYVPISGGGLLSGVGLALKQANPAARLVGVQAANSAFMHSLLTRNTQAGVPDLPSLADGLTGPVAAQSITIPLVRQLADEIIRVEEDAIARAVAFAWENYGETLEGSGAVALAAALDGRTGPGAVIILSGGNIQPEIHAEILKNARVGS
ncbi:MAG: pyridoxal-phosphate dependent enzyme [Anaerolineales bacterium]|jgi:threonine dehydratase|nr:pyridoxal-phosphate dependent enzyme [Anaerolineales bacterium]